MPSRGTLEEALVRAEEKTKPNLARTYDKIDDLGVSGDRQ